MIKFISVLFIIFFGINLLAQNNDQRFCLVTVDSVIFKNHYLILFEKNDMRYLVLSEMQTALDTNSCRYVRLNLNNCYSLALTKIINKKLPDNYLPQLGAYWYIIDSLLVTKGRIFETVVYKSSNLHGLYYSDD